MVAVIGKNIVKAKLIVDTLFASPLKRATILFRSSFGLISFCSSMRVFVGISACGWSGAKPTPKLSEKLWMSVLSTRSSKVPPTTQIQSRSNLELWIVWKMLLLAHLEQLTPAQQAPCHRIHRHLSLSATANEHALALYNITIWPRSNKAKRSIGSVHETFPSGSSVFRHASAQVRGRRMERGEWRRH